MIFKKLSDVIMLLLTAAIVLSCDRIYLYRMEVDPPRVHKGVLSRSHNSDVILAVGKEHCWAAGEKVRDLTVWARSLPAGAGVLVVSSGAEVSHHRVMAVWSRLNDELNVDADLGAEPRTTQRRTE